MGEREPEKIEGAMFLSVGLKVFIPTAICPVAKKLEKNLELYANTPVNGLQQGMRGIRRRNRESVENKGKVVEE